MTDTLLEAAKPKWIVHIAGPDDVLPFESEFAALRHANTVNKMYLRDRMKHPDDEVLCVAVVKHVDEIEPPTAPSVPAAQAEPTIDGWPLYSGLPPQGEKP